MAKKDKILRLRVDQDEYEIIYKNVKKSKKKFSEYAREMLTQNVVESPECRELLSKLITEINYIGHNINQIVKNNNSGLYKKSDKERLSEQIRLVYKKLDEVICHYGG